MPVIPLFSSALPEMCRMEIRRRHPHARFLPPDPALPAPICHHPDTLLCTIPGYLPPTLRTMGYSAGGICSEKPLFSRRRSRIPQKSAAIPPSPSVRDTPPVPQLCWETRCSPRIHRSCAPSGDSLRSRRHGLLRFPSHCRDTIAAFRVGAAGWSEIPYTGSARRMHRPLLRYIRIAAHMGSRNVCCGNPPD